MKRSKKQSYHSITIEDYIVDYYIKAILLQKFNIRTYSISVSETGRPSAELFIVILLEGGVELNAYPDITSKDSFKSSVLINSLSRDNFIQLPDNKRDILEFKNLAFKSTVNKCILACLKKIEQYTMENIKREKIRKMYSSPWESKAYASTDLTSTTFGSGSGGTSSSSSLNRRIRHEELQIQQQELIVPSPRRNIRSMSFQELEQMFQESRADLERYNRAILEEGNDNE